MLKQLFLDINFSPLKDKKVVIVADFIACDRGAVFCCWKTGRIATYVQKVPPGTECTHKLDQTQVQGQTDVDVQ